MVPVATRQEVLTYQEMHSVPIATCQEVLAELSSTSVDLVVALTDFEVEAELVPRDAEHPALS